MSAFIGNFISNLQQAAESAKQARELRARSKTEDGRRIYRIACLGHANAGKTTFWTVIEGATRDLSDQFNLQTGDKATKAYLNRQLEVMQRGTLWSPGEEDRPGERPGIYEPGYPEQTDIVANLLFMARQPGKPECPILVQDYPGGSVAVEDVTGGSAEIAEFLKTADGVLFFVDSVVTRLSRAAIDQQLAAFRSLLRNLEDRQGRIAKPVGLVLTKADNLPGFRPGNPVALLQPSDLRRRGDPFSKFLEQLLRGGAYAQDAAWRDRVGKTMNRVQSFADVLLKKCASPQFFFVSAVGDKRRRPIEHSGDVEASILASFVGTTQTGSVALGKNRVGLEAPVAWMVNELAVQSVINRARQIRNHVWKAAAVWAVIVSLPFMTYLGCTTSRIEKDVRASVVPAPRLLHHVHAFERDWLARFWGLFDRSGYMATARAVQARVAFQVRDEAQRNLESILVRAGGDPSMGGVGLASDCNRWVAALKDCARALPDTSSEAKYLDDARKIDCLIRFYVRLQQAFQVATTDGRRAEISALGQPASGFQYCTTAGIQTAIGNLVSNVLHANIEPATLSLAGGMPAPITAIVGGGTPPYQLAWTGPAGTGPFAGDSSITAGRPGAYTVRVTDAAGAQAEATCTVGGALLSLKERYNAVLARYGPLVLPQDRLKPALIAELQTLAGETAQEPASQEAARRIAAFLQKARPFVEGVNVKISITSVSAPARLKLTPSSPDQYADGDVVTIPGWKIGRLVTVYFVKKDVPQVFKLQIGDLLGSQSQLLPVRGLPARAGGDVTLTYEVVEPSMDEIPSLDPLP
jgi:hypothetical protein